MEGRLLSSQSEQSEKFSKIPDWLEKSRPSKKSHFCFDHVNRLIVSFKYTQKLWQIYLFNLYLMLTNLN